MNRRQFLRSLAVSAGVLSAAPVVAAVSRSPRLEPVVLAWKMQVSATVEDASFKTHLTTRGYVFFLSDERSLMQDFRTWCELWNLHRPMNGYRRQTTTIKREVYSQRIDFEFVDVEV